jgi:endonuclease/exonuclease/phosphatase family metal-dependent hydrolase
MRVMSYNVMEGGVVPDAARLALIRSVVADTNPDIIGLQEVLPDDNRLEQRLAFCGYPFFHKLLAQGEWTHGSTVAFASKFPLRIRQLGQRVRAIGAEINLKHGSVTLVNVYLSHIDEQTRLKEVEEVLRAVSPNANVLLFGDFNSLSFASGLTDADLVNFSPRMCEKYCLGGHLSFEVIRRVILSGYEDVALNFYPIAQITKKTLLSGGSGDHTRPIRMDYFFASKSLAPLITNLQLVDNESALLASDHFPWLVDLARLGGTSGHLGIWAEPKPPIDTPKLAA